MKSKVSFILAVVVVLLFGALGVNLAQQQVTVTFWTDLLEPKRVVIQEELAADFMALHPDIKVEVVPILESDIPTRIAAAYAAGTLPDVLRLSLEYVGGWAEEGILDAAAATALIEKLGVDTFGAKPLESVQVNGGYGAIPTDGWGQLLLYRKDLFEAYDLAVPNNWNDILQAAAVLHDPPNLYGIEVATDPDQVYMQQVFEHFAISNGARLVNKVGNIELTTPEFMATLRFYKLLATSFTPPGNIYWMHTRLDYLAGKAAMTIWSPYILDELAGLRDSAPVTAEFPEGTPALHERTGIVAAFAGPAGAPAQGGAVLYLGITVDADTEAAQAFAEYLLTDGYAKWLSMAPEGMFPMRPAYIDEWKNLSFGVDRFAKISDVYPAEVIATIAAGVDNLDRWGIAAGRSACVSAIYGTRTVIDILRRYIDGEISSAEEAAQMMQDRVKYLSGCEDR